MLCVIIHVSSINVDFLLFYIILVINVTLFVLCSLVLASHVLSCSFAPPSPVVFKYL